jgi:hypothetical protein
MFLTDTQRIEFEKTARPMIKWLNDNCHPHVEVNITPTSARLFEGSFSTGDIFDYVKD